MTKLPLKVHTDECGDFYLGALTAHDGCYPIFLGPEDDVLWDNYVTSCMAVVRARDAIKARLRCPTEAEIAAVRQPSGRHQ